MCVELNDRNIKQIEGIFERKYSEKAKAEREERLEFEKRFLDQFEKFALRIERSQETVQGQTREYFSQEIKIISQNSQAERQMIVFEVNNLKDSLRMYDDELHKRARPEDIENAIRDLKLNFTIKFLSFMGATAFIVWQWAIPELLKKAKGG